MITFFKNIWKLVKGSRWKNSHLENICPTNQITPKFSQWFLPWNFERLFLKGFNKRNPFSFKVKMKCTPILSLVNERTDMAQTEHMTLFRRNLAPSQSLGSIHISQLDNLLYISIFYINWLTKDQLYLLSITWIYSDKWFIPHRTSIVFSSMDISFFTEFIDTFPKICFKWFQ